MKGYVSRTTDELERSILTNLINGLKERITFLGEELMDLEEDEFDFRIKYELSKNGFNYLKEDNFDNTLDEINRKKARLITELNEAKSTYEHIEGMLTERCWQ